MTPAVLSVSFVHSFASFSQKGEMNKAQWLVIAHSQQGHGCGYGGVKEVQGPQCEKPSVLRTSNCNISKYDAVKNK